MPSFPYLNQSVGFHFYQSINSDYENETLILQEGTMNATLDKFSSGFQPWGDYVFGFVLIATGVISLIGNGLAAHVFRGKGRDISVAEVILLNIAMVDLFLAGSSYPATIISAFSHRWIFEDIGCIIYGAVCYFLGVATIMSLMSLAIYRFLRTCYPEKVRFLTSNQTWTRIIFPIYVYSLIWALLPLFGWGGYEVEPFGLSCTLDWSQPDLGGKLYIITASVCCVLAPTLFIIGSHVGILISIRRTGRILGDNRSNKQTGKAEVQLIRVSFGVCFGFLVAWLPYAAFSLWNAFGYASAPPWLTAIPVLLAKSSIAYNPVIYVLMTRRYRLDFTRALVELITWLSRGKREEAVVVPSRNHNEIINNQPHQVDIREQNVTELVTILKDDEPKSHLSSTRRDDNNSSLMRTKSGSKYPRLMEAASIRRTWTTNLSFIWRKKSSQREFGIVSVCPVSV